MQLDIFQIDAFTDRVFGGNPAAVVPLTSWLSDTVLQAIASENNLSETAFFVPFDDGFHIRWFTPVAEVDLCGHATLAAAHVLFSELAYPRDEVTFQSRSGMLRVAINGNLLTLDFPSQPPVRCEPPAALIDALGFIPAHCFKSEDYLVEVEDITALTSLTPHAQALCKLDQRGLIVTAQHGSEGFVSRCFFPKLGIYEDPVTGSAHTQLTPYWAARLGIQSFTATQLSSREGTLFCSLEGDRVQISGQAVKYMSGSITI